MATGVATSGAFAGEMVRLRSRDGFELGAYQVEAEGGRKGGVIVLQEIFGLSNHVREMCDRFAAAGYEAIAPSLYDRARPGFVQNDLSTGYADAVSLATGNDRQNVLNDVGACIDAMSPAGPVFVTGYCYGGSMTWLSACSLPGLAAASGYYGSLIPSLAGLTPLCPTILHFGRTDQSVPLASVEAFAAAQPGVGVHLYDAGHGFSRKASSDYDAAADKLAFDRTLAHFAANSG
ncbi:dienelactone hydrolase family protein [bacterium]|nr:dienelactone hydrolase family protein [bacterium]